MEFVRFVQQEKYDIQEVFRVPFWYGRPFERRITYKNRYILRNIVTHKFQGRGHFKQLGDTVAQVQL